MLHYFDSSISDDLRFLYLHRFLAIISGTLIGSFGVMFAYEVSGHQFIVPVLIMLIAAIVPLFFTAQSNFLLDKLGMRNSVIIGEIFSILTWMAFLFTTPENYMWSLSIATFFLIIYRIFYWVPHNILFATLTRESERAKSVALLSIVADFSALILPIIGGFLILTYGFNVIYVIGVFFALVGLLPLFKMTNRRAYLSWNAGQIWKKQFTKEYRPFVLSEYFQGLELAISVVLWPLVIYMLVEGNTLEVGLIASGTTLFLIIFNFFLARFMDKNHNHGIILKYFTWALSLSWMLRIFVESALQIFASSIFGKISQSGVELPMKTMEFNIAGHDKNLIDEITVLREIPLNLGRITGFIAIGVALFYIPPQGLFVIAAIAVLCLNFITRQQLSKVS